MNFRILILRLCLLAHSMAFTQKTLPKNPVPNKAQLVWQKTELGAVFHYDLHVFDNKKYSQTGTSGNRINPIPNYQKFNPQQLDTDKCIKAVKKAGFKFYSH